MGYFAGIVFAQSFTEIIRQANVKTIWIRHTL